MEDNDLLQPLNERLIDAMLDCGIEEDKWELPGWVRPVFDPTSPQKACLFQCSTDKRWSLDTKRFNTQLAFKLAGGQPITDQVRYGSGGATKWNLTGELLIATRSPQLLTAILKAWAYLPDLQVRGFDTDSLRLLAEKFLFRVTANTAYDPLMRIYAIQFIYMNVTSLPEQ